MQDHVRDTVFGHSIRLTSGNKLLKFPDEMDPSLWKESAQRGTHGDLEKQRKLSSSGNTAMDDSDNQNLDRADPGAENGKDIYLVDWYGPDDLEVRSRSIQVEASDANVRSRTPRTGRAIASCWLLLKYVSSTPQST